jgi:Sigma-70, region 4
MSRLDDLPPDQRAALSLLLRQGKAYAEVAEVLKIGERAVHDRAHAALAALAPREARALSAERREEIGDYLLGQRPGLAERLRTRSLLEGSDAAQAWARAVAAELASLAPGALPDIPDGAGSPDDGDRPPAGPPDRGGSSGVASAGRSAARAAAHLPSSRVGGAILLAAIAAVIVVVVLLTTGGGGHRRASSASGARASSTTPRASETRRLTLASPNPSSRALGVAAVLQEGSTYAFYLAAEHLAPSKGFFYAVWLYNSPTSFEALSKSPAVGSDGRLQGGALLPADAANYRQMIVTRETKERPTRPGPVVLRGSFGLR